MLRVPSVEEEDGWQLHRELRTRQKERTRTTNRIKGLLAHHGIRVGRRLNVSGEGLEQVRLW